MNYVNQLIQDYKNTGLIIDTNIWILLLVGSYDLNLISSFKRTQTFTTDDYKLLEKFLPYFNLIVTPNILTEVSNLTESLNNQTKDNLFLHFKNLVSELNESYVLSIDAMDDCFLKFGLTDSTIYNLSQNQILVLTDDFPLYGFLINKGIMAINYNHLRSELFF